MTIVIFVLFNIRTATTSTLTAKVQEQIETNRTKNKHFYCVFISGLHEVKFILIYTHTQIHVNIRRTKFTLNTKTQMQF